MAAPGDVIQIQPHERVTIVRAEPELLEVEAEYGPSSHRPPAHLHPEQAEHFEVLAGVLAVQTPDGERRYGAGETFDIPRGTPHRMGNGGDEVARVRWQVRPALDMVGFWRAIARARTPLGQLIAVLRHRREFRLTRMR